VGGAPLPPRPGHRPAQISDQSPSASTSATSSRAKRAAARRSGVSVVRRVSWSSCPRPIALLRCFCWGNAAS